MNVSQILLNSYSSTTHAVQKKSKIKLVLYAVSKAKLIQKTIPNLCIKINHNFYFIVVYKIVACVWNELRVLTKLIISLIYILYG